MLPKFLSLPGKHLSLGDRTQIGISHYMGYPIFVSKDILSA